MKIAIVGTGAMGSIYAGLLGSAGHDVWAVDVDAAHVDAIRAAGLRVEGASGDRVVDIRATTDPAEVGAVDLAVIATKAMDVEAAAEAAWPLVGEETIVLSIQNGVGGPQAAASVLGEDRVLVGVVGGFGASLVGAGHAHHHGMELLRLGELHGPATARVEHIAGVWRDAGFNVRTYDDLDRLVWEKLVCNVCFSGTCTVLELTIGEILELPAAWQVASACAEEALAVGLALGVRLEIDDPSAYARDFGRKIPGARPSMLLDLLAGRRTEIDYINGAVARLGRESGVATPANDVVTSLVKGKEAASRR